MRFSIIWLAPSGNPGYLKYFNLFLVFGLLFVFSCSESDPVSVATDVPVTREYNLIPHQDDPIIIEASGPSKIDNGQLGKGSADRGRFDITLKFLTPVSARQREVFDDATKRWQRIIIGDVPSVTATNAPIPSAFGGFPPIADVGETIDDLLIEVVLIPLDGPGGILGAAGPVFLRAENNLTLSGVMFFDVFDLAFLDQFDLLDEVIVHEMGHVLGIGTLWDEGEPLIQGPLEDPYFAGKTANVHWRAEGGTDFLPIENMGGGGTRFSHWRELTLDNELMTGFLNLGENPLSRITAGSLRDLGYKTAMVGEKYQLEKGTPGVDISSFDPEDYSEGVFIAEKETLLKPIGFVKSN